MPTEITVTGCGDCPMYSVLAGGIEICGHPKNEDCTDLSGCPLKTDSLTIKLKQYETHKTDVRGGEQ